VTERGEVCCAGHTQMCTFWVMHAILQRACREPDILCQELQAACLPSGKVASVRGPIYSGDAGCCLFSQLLLIKSYVCAMPVKEG